MGAIVFTSAGSRKYHFHKECTAFHSAQDLSDLDCGCDTYCTHRMPRMHALKQMSATKAAIDGKLPCLSCVPEHLRELPQAESFGHAPVDEYEGTAEGDLGVTHIVCARCAEWARFTEDIWIGVRIPWPCTSAIVLGLVPRPEQVGER